VGRKEKFEVKIVTSANKSDIIYKNGTADLVQNINTS